MERSNICPEHYRPLGGHLEPIRETVPSRAAERNRKTRERVRTYWTKGGSSFRSPIRSALWFIKNWDRKGRPDYVPVSTAAKAIDISVEILAKEFDSGGLLVRDIKRDEKGVYAPSLIEQIRWVPYIDAVRYLNMSEDTFEYYINARGVAHEYRDFRGCVCVELTTVMRIGIWRRVKQWTYRRLSVDLIDALSTFPGEALVELLQVMKNKHSKYLKD